MILLAIFTASMILNAWIIRGMIRDVRKHRQWIVNHRLDRVIRRDNHNRLMMSYDRIIGE